MASDNLLSRIRGREHTVAIGDVEPPDGALLIPVHCDLPGPPLAPLMKLCDRIDSMIGAAGVGPAPRRFAERPTKGRMYSGRLSGTLNRLAASTEHATAVWFHAFERLDPASRELVIGCLREPGWLRLPLVLAFENGGEIADRVVDIVGADAVIEAPSRPSAELPELPDDVLRTLRAAALAGDVFEVETVAELLVEDPVSVLERLQTARDHGVGLRDRGDGVIALPPNTAETLRRGLMPSLRQAWHALLAATHGSAEDLEDALEPRRAEDMPPPLPELEAVFGPVELLPDIEAIVDGSESGPGAVFASKPPRDPASAVHHAAEAGLADDAIANLLAVAQHATDAGAFTDALALVTRAETEAGKLPKSPRAAELRARAELERGTIAWVAVGSPTGDEPMTLKRAVTHMERALEIAAGIGDPQLDAEIRANLAAVCFDLGDRASLERAVDLLTEASRGLSGAGFAIEAAQLLNEQASVWVRLGDPVRAYGLLSASRRIFDRVDTQAAALEIAGTDHQTARLALHAVAQPGRERDALELGMQMAQRAAEAYGRLGMTGELARALETIGRLALRADLLEPAEASLREAFSIQLERRDGIGLARTTAALADLAGRMGDRPGALEALGESVELNIIKGSPVGLAFNLESLERIDPQQATPGSRELAERIRDAQKSVGVVENPGALYHGRA